MTGNPIRWLEHVITNPIPVHTATEGSQTEREKEKLTQFPVAVGYGRGPGEEPKPGNILRWENDALLGTCKRIAGSTDARDRCRPRLKESTLVFLVSVGGHVMQASMGALGSWAW